MAQGATAKSKAANRGRVPRTTRRKTSRTERLSRDTRSRSRANDERRAQRKPKANRKARNPRMQRDVVSNQPKHQRRRATSLAAKRDAR